MSKYQPLADHLSGLTADEWRASFAEVEAVLGFPLPKTATTHGTWWSNEDDKPHKRGWLDAGWRVADVDRREGKVVFERAGRSAAAFVQGVEPPPAGSAQAVVAQPAAAALGSAPKTRLLAVVAGTAALALGLGVTAARLLRRR